MSRRSLLHVALRMVVGLGVVAALPRAAYAQLRGTAALAPLVEGLGVSARVLVIAAHPDDEDTQLIAWLARGRHVETAYLSLTRGDGGQNLIGNELGEALGAIRTEELLAARRVDGARQYFTRAYDFGFSRNAEETLTQWARDSILRDVVTVVRSFRPHVIVAVFSGTPADGHGHHQVSGMLAREAYDVAGDTVRFPRAATAGLPGWTVAKFYRGAFFRNQDKATIRMNVGEYDPILGRSYSEIASDSRSQHKSQAMGSLQLKGVRFDQLMREATRVNEQQDAMSETSLFAGIDTTWGRFAPLVAGDSTLAALDSLPRAIAVAQGALYAARPERAVAPLAVALRTLDRACPLDRCAATSGDVLRADLASTVAVLRGRLHEALTLATGIAVEATAPRELWSIGEPIPVRVTAYNRGRSTVRLTAVTVEASDHGALRSAGRASSQEIEPTPVDRTLLPDSAYRDSTRVVIAAPTQPWWLAVPRAEAMFGVPGSSLPEGGAGVAAWATASFVIEGAQVGVSVPVTFRYADPIRGEVNRPIAGAPAITLLLDEQVTYAQANVPIERAVRVHVRSHASVPRDVEVRVVLPAGLVADSAVRRVSLPAAASSEGAAGFGAQMGMTPAPGADVVQTLTFQVRGRLAPGRHELRAVATSEGRSYAAGFASVAYEHIRTQRLYRPSTLGIQAVDVKVARGTTVGYIAGVGDNVAPALEQLGIAVTRLDPAELARTDISRFTAVVVGTRAYEASDALVANNARLLDYARRGGTLVVQYGQYEMTRPGILPYPISLSRPAERVTVEGAPVRIVDPASPVLSAPNRIVPSDFDGWLQDRALYMPTTFDKAWSAPLETNDPGEKPNRGAILVAPYGNGTFVYTSLAFFRQLPNGVPGAARLFVNLMSAKVSPVRP